MSQKLTLQEIARQLGVSRTTVSYVLSGQARERRVSEETARRIMDLAAARNYVPNAIARSLRRQRTDSIGVVVTDMLLGYAHQLFVGMDRVLGPAGLMPIFLVRQWEALRERKLLQALVARRVEGILVQNPLEENRRFYQQIIEEGMPLLFMGDTLADAPWAASVAWNAGEAAATLVRHLIETGHRRIALVTLDCPSHSNLARAEACERVLREGRLRLQPGWTLSVPRDANLLMIQIKEWVCGLWSARREPPDAIFCVNDFLAATLVNELQAQGIAVPGQVSVAGLGGLPAAFQGKLALTTMEEPVEQIGELAARTLLRTLGGNAMEPHREEITHNNLLIRETTAPRKVIRD